MMAEEAKLASVARELRYRQRVYPRLVAAGKMTQQKADYEIDVFKAIADDYRVKAEGERLL